jgi:hypothetical protein
MPRQIRDVRLQTRDARRQLAPRKEPYWKELRRGLHVGYYKGSTAGMYQQVDERVARHRRRGAPSGRPPPRDGDELLRLLVQVGLARDQHARRHRPG